MPSSAEGPWIERIAVRNANALARIGRILLGTVSAIKKEFPFNYTFDQWNQLLDRSKPLSTRPLPLLHRKRN